MNEIEHLFTYVLTTYISFFSVYSFVPIFCPIFHSRVFQMICNEIIPMSIICVVNICTSKKVLKSRTIPKCSESQKH